MNEVTRETVHVRKHEPPKSTIILHTKLLTYSTISPKETHRPLPAEDTPSQHSHNFTLGHRDPILFYHGPGEH